MKDKLFLALICLTLLVGCNKDDDSPTTAPIQKEEPKKEDPPSPPVLTGIFKDAEVQGLTFETATQNGITDANGEFFYLENEEVTFKIGNVILGTVPGQDLVTPITIAQQTDDDAAISSPVAMNIAALLQTLDADQSHDNGIQITESASSNMGVTEIDFSAPVENTLAKMVVNISQNGGGNLNVVYPETAAMNMAMSLGEEISLEPNYTVSHFMPFLKSFFESSYYSNMPASAVHVHNFDLEGKLISTDIVLRYSGRTVYSLVYDAHAENGLPNKGSLTYNYADLPMGFGASPPSNPITYRIEMTYNAENHVEVMNNLYEGSIVPDPIAFTAYDDANRPLTWSRDFTSEDGSNNSITTYNVTYTNDQMVTEERVYSGESIFGDDRYSYSGTNDYEYSFDAQGNYSKIVLATTTVNSQIVAGEETSSNATSTIENIFMYTSDHKLQSRTRRSDRTEDGVSASFTREFLFDDNEFITVYTFTDEDGFSSESQLQQGIFSSSVSYQDNVLSREEEYMPDGSRIDTQYYYDVNGTLLEIYVDEYDAGYLRTKQTVRDANDEIVQLSYFNDAGYIMSTEYYYEGVLSSIYEYEYDANNFVTRNIIKDPEGNLLADDYYQYENGLLAEIERLDANGNLLATYVYEYDAEGYLSTYIGFFASGNVEFIYFYEAGVIVRGEFYDEQGNLVDVIDYTSSDKKPVSNKIQRKQRQEHPTIDGRSLNKTSMTKIEVLARRNQELILQNQRR